MREVYAKMKLYEIINPSDEMTIQAEQDQDAPATTAAEKRCNQRTPLNESCGGMEFLPPEGP